MGMGATGSKRVVQRSFVDASPPFQFPFPAKPIRNARSFARVLQLSIVASLASHTDSAFLHDTLQQLWSKVAATSPNIQGATPAVRVLKITRQSERELAALLRLMLGAYPS